MEFSKLITSYLYFDNLGMNEVVHGLALKYAEKNFDQAVEDQAKEAFGVVNQHHDGDPIMDAEVMVYYSEEEAEPLNKKYPLLAAYLDKAFEDLDE